MKTPTPHKGSIPIIRRPLTLGIVGFADAGKTEYLLALAAIDKNAIPGWKITRVEEGLQYFLRERVNHGRTAATDVLESKFFDLALLVLESTEPVDGAIIQLELRASDYAGEVFSDFAALSERFKDEAELREWKEQHFPALRSRLSASDAVVFFHHCLSLPQAASRLNYTLLLSQIANTRTQGPLPLIVAVSRADELADGTADPSSLHRLVANALKSSPAELCDPAKYPAQLKASKEAAMAVLDKMFADLRKAIEGPNLLSSAVLVSSWGYFGAARPAAGNQRPNPLQPQGVQFVLDLAIQNALPRIREELRLERETEARRRQEEEEQARRRRFAVAVALVLVAMLAGVVVELYRNSLPS